MKQLLLLALVIVVVGVLGTLYCYGRSARVSVSKTLPKGNAAAQGIDEDALDALLKKAKETDTDAVVIFKDGKVVNESYFGKKEKLISAMSITKSVVSLAIGRLIDEGKIKSLDEPVCHYYSQWNNDKRRLITIRHILNHSSGLTAPVTMADYGGQSDYLKWALNSELEYEPGSNCVYNNKVVSILGGIVKLASGKELDQYIREELFAPLGITQFTWSRDPAGNPGVMAGLSIHAYDLAKIGQLMLDNGKWEGKQIISQNWIEESIHPAAADKRFGLSWYLLYDSSDEHHMIAFNSNGNLGQYLVVYPEYKLVGVRQISRQSYRSEKDEFGEFMKLVLALPRQLEQLPSHDLN